MEQSKRDEIHFLGINTIMETNDSKSENDLPCRQRSFTFNSCEGEDAFREKSP